MGRRVELKVNRDLLDYSFEGYKLGCAFSELKSKPLPSTPSKILLPPGDNSLLHVRLFALHNVLCEDALSNRTYFVDERGSIWCVRCRDGEPTLVCVYENVVPESGQLSYHPCLKLCKNNAAVLSNGRDRLIVFDTGDRNVDDSTRWKIAMDARPLSESFVLLEASSAGNDTIHCILYDIKSGSSHFEGALSWITLNEKDGTWTSKPYCKLICAGPVHYCAFEPECEALLVAADKPANFIDETKKIVEETHQESVEKKPKYYWYQTTDNITLTLLAEPESSRDDFKIVAENDAISVDRRGESLLNGQLFDKIENNCCTWELNADGKLNILLLKRTSNFLWNSFLKKGDPEGEQILDPAMVAEVHARLSHLCSETEATNNDVPVFNTRQLEECDYEMEEESTLSRLCGSTLRMTHRVFLSSHPVILNVKISNSEATAIGLRCDDDTCIWQPYKSTDEDWEIKHEGTLLAFGYVQASNKRKKYVACSPNLEYSVVCEINKNAFVYRQKQKNVQLRQRLSSGDTRNVKMGVTQVVSFERGEEVLGVCATNEILYFLTDKSIIALDMAQ